MNDNSVITRFPPSPTGFLHIGGVRTALFNFLFAKHHGGEMIFRFEDTDRERSKPEFEQDIIDGIHWLGLQYRQPAVFRQSERTEVYKTYLKQLIDSGHAHEAEDSTAAPGMKVVRFKNPNTTVTFADAVRGDVSFDTTELGDFIIARTHDLPLYHLAVVIDDAEAGVTHVIRGEDHISNTQRQILLIEAMGFARPQYAHIPLILAPDRTKLSKRHGAVSVNEYRRLGFLPEAVINYLVLLGWNPGGEQEVFTLDELIQQFDLARVHKAGAVFDTEKLKWFNHEHLKRLSDEDYLSRLTGFMGERGEVVPVYLERILPELRNRAQTFGEAADALKNGEFSFMEDTIPAPDAELLLKGAKAEADAVKTHLQKVMELLATTDAFTHEAVKEALFPYATEVGRASVLWPMRVALSGKEKSPDPFTLAGLLGKETTISRIEKAASML
jgi:glutamyl-tRNA synthetase